MECLIRKRKIDERVKRELIVKINEIQHLLDVEYQRTRRTELINLYNSFGTLAEIINNL